jgi:DeoR/GlpR family transcriptional regulator of sugar metabolism
MTLDELSETRGVDLISLGGEYFPGYDAYFGIVCERAIASLSADVFFTSAPRYRGVACSTRYRIP